MTVTEVVRGDDARPGKPPTLDSRLGFPARFRLRAEPAPRPVGRPESESRSDVTIVTSSPNKTVQSHRPLKRMVAQTSQFVCILVLSDGAGDSSMRSVRKSAHRDKAVGHEAAKFFASSLLLPAAKLEIAASIALISAAGPEFGQWR